MGPGMRDKSLRIIEMGRGFIIIAMGTSTLGTGKMISSMEWGFTYLQMENDMRGNSNLVPRMGVESTSM